MSIVTAHHERTADRPVPVLIRASKSQRYTPHHIRQECRHCSLFRIGAHLLIVETAVYVHCVSVVRIKKSLHGCKSTLEIIQLGRRYELLFISPEHRLLAVHKEKIFSKYIFCIHAEFICYHPVKAAFSHFTGGKHRTQIYLSVIFISAVDLSVEMYSHIRYQQQIPVDMDQSCFYR